ncbi:MAG: flagellar hook-associated protein FlgL [Bdellovibrionales bacterium]|nr:flagellar hook-associated protein FlgL [Bdellovibrionales bacterium]
MTQNTNFQVLHDAITRSKDRMTQYQNQLSTMKKVNVPSDDPVASAKILEIRTDKVNNEQFEANVKMAETYLNNTDTVLAELADVVMRAKEIAIGQASGASSNESTRIGVAEEIGQLYLQSVAAANRRVGDRYLLGGYRTDQAPVDPDGRYIGDDGEMLVEVSRDVFVSMNVPGLGIFNTAPEDSADSHRLKQSRAPASQEETEVDPGAEFEGRAEPVRTENINLFGEIQALRTHLLTGNMEGIRSTLERFDTLQERLVAMRAKVGARVSGLQSTLSSIDRTSITNAHLNSALEDADMAKVMSDLAKEETVFRTALQSSQRLVQPTLMEFLR